MFLLCLGSLIYTYDLQSLLIFYHVTEYHSSSRLTDNSLYVHTIVWVNQCVDTWVISHLSIVNNEYFFINWWTHIWVLAFNSFEALTTNGIAMPSLYDFLSGCIISCFYLTCIRVLISQHLCQCLWCATQSGILVEFGSDCPDLFCDILITIWW